MSKPTIYKDNQGEETDLANCDFIVSVHNGSVTGIWSRHINPKILLVDSDELCDETEGTHNGQAAAARFEGAVRAACETGRLAEHFDWNG